MARDMESRFFAEPEFVDSSVDLGGYNPQILQNQFAVQPQTTAAASPAVDLGNYDFGGLGLGNYNFGNFDLSAFQPQYNEPVYSQPTAQPAPYYGDYGNYDFGNFDLGAFQQQYGAPEPVYSQPTPQPTQAVPYYEEPLVQEFVPPARTYPPMPEAPVSTYSPTDYGFDPYNIGDVGLASYAAPSYQSLPTPQPVQTAPYTEDYGASLSPTSAYAAPVMSGTAGIDTRMMAGMRQYSPEVQSYLDQVNALAAARKPTIGSFSSAVPTTSYTTEDFWGGNRIMPEYVPEEELAPYLSRPAEQNLQYTFDVPSNKNKSTGGVSVSYNTPIALINNATGEVVKAGVGFDAAQQIAEMARQLSTTEGKKAQWSIYTAPPGATDVNQFKPVATEKKDKSFLGSVLSVVAPIAGTLLAGPLGLGALGLGSVGTGALGAALGSGALGVARGESLGDILKKAAISGAGAFAGGTLGNAIGAGGSKAASSALANTTGGAGSATGTAAGTGLGQAAASGLDDIIVTALLNKAPQLIGSGIGTAGSTALTEILNSMPSMQWKPDNLVDLGNGKSFDVDTGEIVVTGSRGTGAGISTGGALGGGTGAVVSDLLAPETVVTGTRLPQETPKAETNAGSGAGGLAGDIVVTADTGVKLPSDTTKIVESLGAGLGGALSGTGSGGSNTGGDGAPKDKGAGSTIGKVVGGLTIADALAKILGKVFGGGGSGGTSPGGQQLQSVFSAKLPRASGIFAPENLAPRDTSGIDYYRYGFGPEAAFFRNVPTSDAERTALVNAYRPSQLALSGTGGATSSASAVSDPAAMLNQLSSELAAAGISEADFNAYLQTPEGQQALLAMLGGTPFAKGGSTPMRHAKRVSRESFAVEGPGTGRSDEIPAVLSDGEYVIDAETVALLGDGSSKAGAKKLDEFRVNVRKHKGRNLAKGKFSVNAKRPEKYLSGGRT